MEKFIHPRFVTPNELDPLTASCLNVRFVMFLRNLASDLNLDYEYVGTVAREILADADIAQYKD